MRSRHRSIRVAVMVAVLTAGFAATPTAPAAAPPDLFVPDHARVVDAPGSVRARAVRPTVDLATHPGPLRVTLNVFPDRVVPVLLDRQAGGDGSVVWSGTIPGRPGRSVLLVARDGFVFGNVHLGADGEFVIHDGGDGSLVIREVDPESLPEEGGPLPVAGSGMATSVPEMAADVSGQPVVDVMIVWGHSVLTGSAPFLGFGGSEAAGRVWAETRIAELNGILADSGIAATARLAYAGTADDYDEGGDDASSIVGDLRHLTYRVGEADCSPDPGFQDCDPTGLLDRELGQRDQLGADLVILVVQEPDEFGIAWVNCSYAGGAKPSAGYCSSDFGFAVVEFGSADTFFSMSHEIGHLFGGRHDADAGTAPGVAGTTYNRGYRVPGSFSTVVAYVCNFDAGCSGYAERVGHFSNPAVLWEGTTPMGIPIGSPGEADNASHFAVSIPIVAAFRDRADCRGRTPTIIGTDAGETITGTSGDDVIMGFGGADTIYGLGGDDLICAGNGADLVYGGDGKDRIYGENGPDMIFGNEKSDRLYGGDNDDILRGGDGTRDRLYGGAGFDDLDGGAGFDDRCTLGEAADRCEVIF